MNLSKIKLSDFNNRIYNKETLDNLIKRSNNNILYGEINKPECFDVSFSNVSHIINNIEIYDDGIYGNIEILDTNKGKIVKKLIENNISFGISERSIGTIDNNNNVIISKLFTYDLVLDDDWKIKRRVDIINRIKKIYENK